MLTTVLKLILPITLSAFDMQPTVTNSDRAVGTETLQSCNNLPVQCQLITRESKTNNCSAANSPPALHNFKLIGISSICSNYSLHSFSASSDK